MSPLMAAIELENQIRNNSALLYGTRSSSKYTVCYQRLLQIVKKIVRVSGANLDLRGTNLQRSALFYAKNNPKITKLLVEAGADVNLRDSLGQTALMSSVLELGFLELNFYDEHIDYDDHEEEAFRLVSSIEELLKAPGISVDVQCRDGTSVLMVAAGRMKSIPLPKTCGKICAMMEVARMLIDGGVDVNAKDEYGNTALMIACRRNSSNFVSVLMEKVMESNVEVHVNEKDKFDGQTALMKLLDTNWNEDSDNTDILKTLRMLLSFPGIDVDLQDFHGCTAISYSVRKKKFLSTEALLNHGADVNIRDFKGRSILQKCKCDDIKCMIKPFNKRKRHMCKFCGHPKKDHPRKCPRIQKTFFTSHSKERDNCSG